jgi:hypothetical protein
VIRFFPRRDSDQLANICAGLWLLLLGSLLYGFSYQTESLPVFFVQATLILVLAHGLGFTRGVAHADTPTRLLLGLSGFGAVVYASVTFYFSPYRSWQSGMLALPFGFAAGLTLLLNVAPARSRALFRVLSTGMLVLTVVCVARQHFHAIYRDAPVQALQTPFRTPKLRGIYSTAERVRAVDALFEYLHPHVARGERLLVFDDCPMLYYLFDALPAYGMTWATRYTQSRAALEQLDREFRAKPLPNYALRLVVDTSDAVWGTGRQINYDDYPLNDTVVANYVLEHTIFPFEIWRLRSH